MIKSLSVKGLNHRIDADLEFNEDLNIVTGRNGSGKTTLLKLIWYLISGKLEQIIHEIPFQFVSIQTESFSFAIARIVPNKITVSAEFSGEKGTGGTGSVEQFEKELQAELSRKIVSTTQRSLFFPTFRRIEGGFSGTRSSFAGNIPIAGFDRFHTDRPNGKYTDRATERLQDALSQLSAELSANDHEFIASISTDDIGQLLEQKYGDVHKEISNLQSKVLDEISQRLEDVPSVMTDIQQVADERNRLLKPFSVLSELTQSILQYEAIRIGGRDALGEATEGITLGEGTEGTALEGAKEAIASDKLSSGEKQMLSFLCYNAFSENTPIFIDEPELSLHVDWQRILLPTLLEQGTGNQFFIATHSPFIYAKYPDKEIPLGDKGEAN